MCKTYVLKNSISLIVTLVLITGCEANFPEPTKLLKVKGFVGPVPHSCDTPGTIHSTACVFLQRHTYTDPMTGEHGFSNVSNADVKVITPDDTFNLNNMNFGVYYLESIAFQTPPGDTCKIIIETPQDEKMVYSVKIPEYSLHITEPSYGISIPQDTTITIKWRYEGEDTFPEIQWGLKWWESKEIENIRGISFDKRTWTVGFVFSKGATYDTRVGVLGGYIAIIEEGVEYNYNHYMFASPEPEIMGATGQIIKFTLITKKDHKCYSKH